MHYYLENRPTPKYQPAPTRFINSIKLIVLQAEPKQQAQKML